MKKIYSLLLLGGLLLFGAQNAQARWVGNSAINFNNVWYNGSASWGAGGAFNGHDFGTISYLWLGGQAQVYTADGDAGNWGSGTMQMYYTFDGAEPFTEHTLTWYKYEPNNNFLQSNGEDFNAEQIDISGLTPGRHTISIYFYSANGESDKAYDSNDSKNYVATFYIASPLTLNSVDATDGYATFCGAYNYTVENATAYKAALNGSYLTLTAVNSENEIIPANAGVILVGSSGATNVKINYTSSTATANMSGNVLSGTTAAATTESLTPANNYFYAFNKTDNTFKQYTGTNFPANKAYFVSTTEFQAPNAIRFEDEETDIQSVVGEEVAVKFFENGQLFILRDGVKYDAIGRIVK